MAYAKFATIANLLQNSKIHLKTRVKFLNSFVCSRLTYSCQNWNLTLDQFEKLDVTYRNRNLIDISSIMKKFRQYDAHPMLATHWKTAKDYAGHVIRIRIERCEKQLIFNNDKYHRIGRVTPSLLQQVLKFNNSTIDNLINNSLKRWIENSTSSPI